MIRIFFFLLTIPFNDFQGHQIGCLNSMPNQCNLSQIVSNHAVFAIYIWQRTKKTETTKTINIFRQIKCRYLKTGSDKMIHWLGRQSFFWVLLCQKTQKVCDLVFKCSVQNLIRFLTFWIKPSRKEYVPSQKINLSDPVFRFC